MRTKGGKDKKEKGCDRGAACLTCHEAPCNLLQEVIAKGSTAADWGDVADGGEVADGSETADDGSTADWGSNAADEGSPADSEAYGNQAAGACREAAHDGGKVAEGSQTADGFTAADDGSTADWVCKAADAGSRADSEAYGNQAAGVCNEATHDGCQPADGSQSDLNPDYRPQYKTGAEHPRNRLNHLSGEEWLYFTKTVMTTAYPSILGQKLRREHGANKPPQLMQELIAFFTKGNGVVLDPFAGVGGTLLGASLCNPPRKSVGIEINPKWIEIYDRVLDMYPELTPGTMHTGDCRKVMETMADNSVDFIVTDPPYNMQLKRTMCTGNDSGHANRNTDYNMISEEELDIANSGSYKEYLQAMGEVFQGCFRILKPGTYMVVIVRNSYQDGRYIFTQADLAQVAQDLPGGRGFVPKGEKIWYQAGTRLRPYGYPFAYVPNIVHQYILVLQKPKK